MRRFLAVCFSGLVLASSGATAEDAAISDGEVSISRAELKHIIDSWPAEMKKAAADHEGERLELLNTALAARKMAAEVEAMTPEEAGDDYWDYRARLVSMQAKFRTQQYLKSLEYPDMDKLARERYETEKDKYALVPEKRLSSHILFKCVAGQCNRGELRPKVEAVVEELRNGADFEAMVEEYSDDPRSKANGGRFNRWMQLGEMGVVPEYTGGLFEIESVGEYSDPVDTRFGLHIIRLDKVEPEHYLPYEEVKGKIVEDLMAEYRKLSLEEFQAQYLISDEAYIDGAVLDELLAPYKSE